MGEWLSAIAEFLKSLSWQQQVLLGGVLFAVTFTGSIALTAWVLVKLPATYFLKSHPPALAASHPVLRWSGRIGKNLLGILLILLGVVMSFPGVPGQGVLTVVLGVMLMDFPGKRHLERKLVSYATVRQAIDRLRTRFGQPPLVLDEEPTDDPRVPPTSAAIRETEMAVTHAPFAAENPQTLVSHVTPSGTVNSSTPPGPRFGTLMDWLGRRSPVAIVIAGTLLMLGIGALDLYTGPEYSFLVFYLLPFFLLTWFVGCRAGVWGSFLFTAIWLLDHMLHLSRHANIWIPLWNAAVRLAFFLTITYVFSLLREALQRERELSRTDPLTGVANLRQFLELANHEVARSHRNQQPFTLVYVDIDGFKQVNDRHGHVVGDSLLRSVAQTMRGCIRQTDILARLGGDEFVLLLPETGLEAAEAACRKVQQHLLADCQQHDWPIGFSFGVLTCLQPPACTPAELIKRADDLMYAAKRDGKNTIKHEIMS